MEEVSAPAEASPTPESLHREAVTRLLVDLQGLSPSQLIRQFLKVQERRVAAYAEFEGNIRSMLAESSFGDFSFICSSATENFSALSAEAVAVIELLKERGETAAAHLSSKVQVGYLPPHATPFASQLQNYNHFRMHCTEF